ncbi:Hachiman antiphage defense system protein HamA [Rhodococcus baikonurensis]|uniref:Hachiman antiphage defense system protein HamA n=1 Tax=Rhodococcus baikonurensis TaxID=172041 RepID=UPI00379198FF
MVSIKSWAPSTRENVGSNRFVEHMVATEDTTDVGIAWLASAVPRHYASSERVASILRGLGKPEAAKFIENKLPLTKRIRSGDLGEIIGTIFVSEELGYQVVLRLRWKDHREMAMRGDDVLGFRLTSAGSIEFLKGEVKSRSRLDATTVSAADNALRSDDGLPSPHAVEFVSDRLHESGDDVLAGHIDRALLSTGIAQRQVTHLLFTFTGSDPRTLLVKNTKTLTGSIPRLAVGLQVPQHQSFISAVYAQVIADA